MLLKNLIAVDIKFHRYLKRLTDLVTVAGNTVTILVSGVIVLATVFAVGTVSVIPTVSAVASVSRQPVQLLVEIAGVRVSIAVASCK